MNDRIRQIRKVLDLTQKEFGEPLGLKPNAISNMETGTNTVTEQNIKTICLVYNISREWFTTGEGEMFAKGGDPASLLIERVMNGESEFAKSLFRGFSRFDSSDWRKLEELVEKFRSGYAQGENRRYE